MSSGRTHITVTLLATPVPALAVLVASGDPGLTLWAAGGCLAGIFLTPDLDQEGINQAEWIIIRVTLGLGYVWPAFWGPYSILIPHRSILSHLPVLGTIIRVLYLYGGLWLLGRLGWSWATTLPPFSALLQTPWVQAALIGLVVSDLLHWVFDVIPGLQRRMNRR